MHFVGVGGAGMSAYARAAHALGARGERLRRRGRPLPASAGAPTACSRRSRAHAPRTSRGGGRRALLLLGGRGREPASGRAARERGLPERPRAELLGELSAMRRTIAVAGTHGKTTTASMLVHALRAAGMQPGWLVGAPIGGGLANAQWGEGEWLVVEADESDRSMLSLSVEIAVLTNVELDHHATFASLAAAGGRVPRVPGAGAHRGRRVGPPELLALVPAAGGVEVVAYDVREPRARAGRLALRLARARGGARGARRAQRARRRRGARGGAPRRAPSRCSRSPAWLASAAPAGAFSRSVRAPGGALVYEDYAHHPTEVAATLRAARTLSSTGGWWRCSSRTCTRARRCSRESSGRRWRSPTWWSCSTCTRRASAPRITPA